LTSHVITFSLKSDESYDKWYNFLEWIATGTIREISSYDDTYYTGTMYKAYKVDDEKDLAYILLKWKVTYQGDYHKWSDMRREIEETVYREEDIRWIETDD
jgi:hypothetical protein